jgi:class 3 adenylate cyclase
MQHALTTHHDLLRRAIERHNGIVFETVGDAVYAVFEKPSDALASAIACHRALLENDWGEVAALRARMAVHTGEVELQRDGRHYVGSPSYDARVYSSWATADRRWYRTRQRSSSAVFCRPARD